MKSKTDINTNGILALLPLAWRPYGQVMRLDRPIGWWLLVLPAYWAILTAGIEGDASSFSNLKLMAIFTVGAIIMRGAGCIVNDLWDRDLDRAVERTAKRAIAARMISTQRALIFLFGLALVGAMILLSLPPMALWIGLASLPLIVIYPLAKRFVRLPQVILALTFAWGVWLGWTAHGIMPVGMTALMYGATAFWIFGYDTIYAIQDMADDAKVGIQSSALTLGGKVIPVIALCYMLFLAGLLLVGAMREAHFVYYIGLAVLAIHLHWQIKQIDISDPERAGFVFRSNRDAGMIVATALLVESIFF